MSFKDVANWQREMRLPCGDQDFNDDSFKRRRMRIMAEEMAETLSALTGSRVTIKVGMWEISVWEKADPVEFLDGLCDLTWVAMGSAAELGWDFDGAFQEITHSNYSKFGAEMVDGKLQKGPNYNQPELAEFAKRK